MSHDGVLVRLRSGGRTRASVLAATMTLSGFGVFAAAPANAAVYTGEATITPATATSVTTAEHTIKITNKGSGTQYFGSAQVLLPASFSNASVVSTVTVSGAVKDSNATTEDKAWTAAYHTKDHHAQWPCPTGVSSCTKLALAVGHDKGGLQPNGYVEVKIRATAPAGTPTTTWTVHGWEDKNFRGNNTFSYAAQPAVTVNKAAQNITFPQLAGQTFGAAPFTVSATGGLSGQPVTFAVKNPTDKCTTGGTNGATVSLTGAGPCTIVASQAGNDSYHAAVSVERTFTIAQASQEITFDGLPSKKYLEPAFSVAAAARGGDSGNPVTFAVKNATDKCTTGGTNGATVSLTGAGSCTIVASQAGNANYTAAAAVERTFSITKADAVLGVTNVTGTYDGSAKSATATSTPANLDGVSVTYTVNGQPVTNPTNAGTYAVRATLDNADYAAESVTGQLVIHPKTVAAVFTVAPKVYDGGTTATIGTRSLTGVVGSDAVQLTGGTATYNDRHVGTKTVTGSDFTLGGSAAGNYTLDPEVAITASAQITAKPITGAITAGDKIYDGSNTASVGAVNPEGEFVGGDAVVLGASNGRFATVNAGAQTVTADLALTGSNAGNYSLTSATATVQANITPKDASVTPNAADKPYGANDPTFTGALDGFLTADGITATYSRTAGEDVGGIYTISATLSPAAKLPNYNITYYTAALTISKAATSTTVTCPVTGSTYTGAPLAPCSASVTGPGGLSQTLTVTHTDNVNAGQGTASAAYAGSSNYLGSEDSKTFAIAKAATTTTVSCTAGTYAYSGAAHEPCTAAVIGAGLDLTPTVSYTDNTNAGTATASVTYAESANHLGSRDSKTFTIAKADQPIVFDALSSKRFGDPTFTVAATGGTSGNPVTFAVKSTTDKCTTGGTNGTTVTLTGAGSCTIVASQAGGNNHSAATPVERSFDILKAGAVLSLPAATATYDGTSKAASVTTNPSSLQGDVTVTYTLNGQTVAAPTNAGTYAVRATLEHPDYASEAVTGQLVIHPAATTTTVSCTAAAYTYSGDAHEPCTARVTGPGALDQPVAVVYSDNTNAGTATASASYAASANHTASSDSKTFTIGKATGSVSINNMPTTAVVGGSFTPGYTKAGDGAASTSASTSTSAVCTVSGGVVTYAATGTCTLQASVAAGTNHNAATGEIQSFTVAAPPVTWTKSGYFAPVDVNTSTKKYLNTVKAGSTVPLKFQLFKNAVEYKETTGLSFAVKGITCDTTATLDQVGDLTTGSTALRYDGTQFIQNWKTPTTLGCYQANVTMPDGQLVTADFRILK